MKKSLMIAGVVTVIVVGFILYITWPERVEAPEIQGPVQENVE